MQQTLMPDSTTPSAMMPPPADDLLAALYPPLLAGLLSGDRRACDAVVTEALAGGMPILVLYQRLLQPALYEIGEQWAQNRISVGIEHLATAIVEGLLNQLYPRIVAGPRNGRRIVVSSVEGELHQVGAKMVCDVFEMHGWDALYLGANTPTSELLRTVKTLTPDAVGLSLSLGFHLDALRGALQQLRTAHPQLPILIGGQGLRQSPEPISSDPNVHGFRDLDALDRFIARL